MDSTAHSASEDMVTVAETPADLMIRGNIDNAETEEIHLEMSSFSTGDRITALNGTSLAGSDVSANAQSDASVNHIYNGNSYLIWISVISCLSEKTSKTFVNIAFSNYSLLFIFIRYAIYWRAFSHLCCWKLLMRFCRGCGCCAFRFLPLLYSSFSSQFLVAQPIMPLIA